MDLYFFEKGLFGLMTVVSTFWISTLSGPVTTPPPMAQSLISPVTQDQSVPLSTSILEPENIVGLLEHEEIPSVNVLPEVLGVSTPTLHPILARATKAPVSPPHATPSIQPLAQETTKPITQVSPTPVRVIETPAPTSESEVNLQIPEPSKAITQKSLSSEVLLQLINSYRETKSLPPFEKDEQLCKLAEYRAPQLNDEIYVTHTVHKGLYDLKLPYYITENMASYPSEQQVFNWWLGSKIHRTAIESNAQYTCGVCAGNSCAQLFTSYIPRS